MSLNLGLVLRASALAHPEKTALVLGETSLSYGQLHTYVQRFAGGLKGLGLRKGQHVALLLPNVRPWPAPVARGRHSTPAGGRQAGTLDGRAASRVSTSQCRWARRSAIPSGERGSPSQAPSRAGA